MVYRVLRSLRLTSCTFARLPCGDVAHNVTVIATDMHLQLR